MRTIYFEKDIPRVLLARALRPIWPGVVFSSLSPTRFDEMAEAPLPDPHWARVRNRLCGICTTDLHLLNVETDPKIALAALPGTSRIYLGHEVAGEVSEVGSEVSDLRVGDRVTMDAQLPNCRSQGIEPLCHHCRAGNPFLCENASLGQGPQAQGGGWGDAFMVHESMLYKVPDALDDDCVAMIEPLSVGVRAALRRLPTSDERTLVVGCGTIGLTVVQAVRALSPRCHITAMARYPQQVEMARKLGADEIIEKGDPYVETARLTGGKLYAGMMNNRMILGGFDVIYDCIGSGRTLQDSLRWTRAGGTMVLVGTVLERMHVDLTPICFQEVNLTGLVSHGMEERAGVRQSTFDLTTDLLLQSKLTVAGLITHRFPLEEWHAAVRTAADKRSGAIKVVLDYRPGT
jgi:threonine dehydrogenase-like Zn-dependent dehydrogenase